MQLEDEQDREDDLAALLLLLLASFEIQLIEHLGEPPNLNNVPVEFWFTFESDLTDTIAESLRDTFVASALLHGAADEEIARHQGTVWAAETATELAALIVATTSDRLRRAVEAFAVDNDRAAFNEDIGKLFSDDRAGLIAADVVIRAQTRGGEVFNEISADDVWRTAGDEKVCVICQPLDGQPRTVWGLVYGDGPPAHGMCRCYISYTI